MRILLPAVAIALLGATSAVALRDAAGCSSGARGGRSARAGADGAHRRRHLLAGAAALSAVARRRVRRRLLSGAAAEPRAARLEGLQPIAAFLRERRAKGDGFRTRPSLFWFAGERDGAVDRLLDLHAIAGLALSVPLVVLGGGGALQMGLLWLLYLSLVSVGQIWYQFGWESLLCEMGFRRDLCGERGRADAGGGGVGAAQLLFRVMLGAGLIKLRGEFLLARPLSDGFLLRDAAGADAALAPAPLRAQGLAPLRNLRGAVGRRGRHAFPPAPPRRIRRAGRARAGARRCGRRRRRCSFSSRRCSSPAATSPS